MLQSPLKHPNAQSAYPEPWQELPAPGHLIHLEDRTYGLWDGQEPLVVVQAGAVPAQGGAKAQNQEMWVCMQHSTGKQDGSTSPFWRGKLVHLELICTERNIRELWFQQVTLMNSNWLGCRKFSSCHYSLLFSSLHMSHIKKITWILFWV